MLLLLLENLVLLLDLFYLFYLYFLFHLENNYFHHIVMHMLFQLMNYLFGLGAVLCLVLSAYHRMARAAGLPDKPWHYSVGLLAEYFCAAAVAQGVYVSFFCAAAVWMMAEMSRLRPAEE